MNSKYIYIYIYTPRRAEYPVEACISGFFREKNSAALLFDLQLEGKYKHVLSIEDMYVLGVRHEDLEDFWNLEHEWKHCTDYDFSSDEDDRNRSRDDERTYSDEDD